MQLQMRLMPDKREKSRERERVTDDANKWQRKLV